MPREYKTLGAERKSKILSIPLKEDDVRNIEAVAKALGQSKTEWARGVILDALQPAEG